MWPRVTKATPTPGAPTYFTEGSNSGRAGITHPEEWETLVTPHTTAQRMQVVTDTVLVSINIVSDSAYVVGMTKSIGLQKLNMLILRNYSSYFSNFKKPLAPVPFLSLLHIFKLTPLSWGRSPLAILRLAF